MIAATQFCASGSPAVMSLEMPSPAKLRGARCSRPFALNVSHTSSKVSSGGTYARKSEPAVLIQREIENAKS